MAKRYLIVGASAAGVSAAVKLRQLDQQAAIVCFSEEKELPYNKCFLADYLHTIKTVADITLRTPQFLEEQRISLQLGKKITRIIPQERCVVDQNNCRYKYDALLLAVGGSVHLPSIKGIEQPHVMPFYTLYDSHALLHMAQSETIEDVVIIGAGLSGLECADALSGFIKNITVIERAEHVLPVQTTIEGSHVIKKALIKQNIQLFVGRTLVEITQEAVILDDGQKIKAQKVIVACGARPNGWLAQEAGLLTHQGAIVTNNFLVTSNPFIFAAGDVALVKNIVTGKLIKSCTWPDALIQGSVAASNMTGIPKEYAGVVTITSSAFFGVKFFSAGIINVNEYKYQSKIEESSDSYRLIVHDQGIVKGFLLIGNTHGIVELKHALLTQKSLLNVLR